MDRAAESWSHRNFQEPGGKVITQVPPYPACVSAFLMFHQSVSFIWGRHDCNLTVNLTLGPFSSDARASPISGYHSPSWNLAPCLQQFSSAFQDFVQGRSPKRVQIQSGGSTSLQLTHCSFSPGVPHFIGSILSPKAPQPWVKKSNSCFLAIETRQLQINRTDANQPAEHIATGLPDYP